MEAAGYLRDVVVGDAEAAASARIAAARTILDHATRGVERDEVMTRLERLESLTRPRTAA